MRVRLRQAVVLLLLPVALECGCAGRSDTIAESDVLIGQRGAIAPAVRGAQNGLELRWWVLDNQPERVARELWPYLNQPSPIDPITAMHWRENGLRLIAIPLADVTSLKNRLPMLGRIDRHWLGQAPRWTRLLDGEPLLNPVSREGQRLQLPAGRMRLLGRAWTVPGLTAKPMMRLDLAFQFEDDQSRRDPFSRGLSAQPTSLLQHGEIFDDLTVHVELQEGWAYLLVPEDPANEWDARGLAVPENQYDWGEVFGPPAPPVPTLGEALLTTLGAPSRQLPRRDYRAVVLLIPRVPEVYRLLPGEAIAASN
jgi:hypothetical protein